MENTMASLAKFDISPRGEGFLLQLADESGQVVSMTVTAEQLDALIDAADDLLADDDSLFEVDEDEEG
jgi:hypothetical protein